MEGFVTGFGNPDWARTHTTANSTAPAVLALLRAGATCVGRTVMDEMAYRLVFSVGILIIYLIMPFFFVRLYTEWLKKVGSIWYHFNCIYSKRMLLVFLANLIVYNVRKSIYSLSYFWTSSDGSFCYQHHLIYLLLYCKPKRRGTSTCKRREYLLNIFPVNMLEIRRIQISNLFIVSFPLDCVISDEVWWYS